MRRKITYVRVHTCPFVPGLPAYKLVLDGKEYKGIDMTYTEEGVEVKHAGKMFIIPLANVVNAVFASEPTKAPASDSAA